MLSLLARVDNRIKWTVRNCYQYIFFLMVLFEEWKKGGPDQELTWGDVLVEFSFRCQDISPASAQRQQIERGMLWLKGKRPHLERICRLFLKAFWWSCQYFLYRCGATSPAIAGGSRLCRFYSSEQEAGELPAGLQQASQEEPSPMSQRGKRILGRPGHSAFRQTAQCGRPGML